MMRYKIYQVVDSNLTVGSSMNPAQGKVLVEEYFGHTYVHDSMEQALEAIEKHGENYVEYTILPYVFLYK